MTLPIKFEDTWCEDVHLKSTWRGKKRCSEKEAQTPKEMYLFEEAETQTGVFTEIVEKIISSEDAGSTVLQYLTIRCPHRSEEEWARMVEEGKASVDGEVAKGDLRLEAEQYLEVVNETISVQTEILKSDFGAQMDGDDMIEYEREVPDSLADDINSFLRRVVPEVEEALEANSSSTAFDGYFQFLSGEGHDEDVKLWKTLTVDLEKHKVIYPDWSKGQHFSGTVVNKHITRNKERIYDIDISDGTRLSNVREEYIRAIVTPSGMHSPMGGSRSRLRDGSSSQQPQLAEGMRLHACVKRSANPKASVVFLPGRVTKAHRNGSVDVECEGGVTKLGLVADDILVGLNEGQDVEARKPLLTPLECTGVSWSCNGSIVAASYGRLGIQGWCDLPGAVCTWSLFSRDFQEKQPTCILDHTVCLMCVQFHPTNPSLLAAGSFNGEVVVWDLNTPDGAVKMSPISEQGHNDPVMSLQWVYNSHSQAYVLASLGADGKLLLWDMSSDFQTPHKGTVLSNPHAVAKRGGTYPSTHGGTALAIATGFSATRPKWVLAGQEGGGIVRAQATRLLNAADTGGKTTKTGNKYHSLKRSAETFAHDAHIGPVTSIDCSPFHRSLFLTGGQDGSVRLYHMLETSPLFQWEPVPPPEKTDLDLTFAPVSCVRFSQTRPAVFAASSRDGFVYVFDLLRSQSGPVHILEVPPVESWGGGKKARSARVHVSGLSFNKKQRDLLSVCDDAGRVLVYQLGWGLANKTGAHEQAAIDRIGLVTVDED